MLFALILGAILGFVPLETPVAFLVLAVVLALKAFIDVRFEKLPYINQPSPFLLYCHNLAESGEPTGFAWISYSLQLFVFGMIFGGGLLAFARFLRTSGF
ncbi:MAG: hypothetical protein OEW79_01605 [Betaproteobacteria bacterium]|jgi:hypothetical protein|nr:hypothetical protein [Betaproteobacteria bacterium]MDH5341508.1 hypothetical protein [Betaproteobacteria bacterium]